MGDILNYDDYTIAWLAVLPIEAEAALGMLDKRHEGQFESVRGDDYIYVGGEINGHNIVVATWPAGQNYGVGAAAALVNQVKARFPNIWFALLVGVAAGLPNLSPTDPAKRRDIRLGDVLVCVPEKASCGIIHYDLGKDTESGFMPNGRQAETPAIVRAAIGNIQLTKKRPFKTGSTFATQLAVFQNDAEDVKFRFRSQEEDILFASSKEEGAPQTLIERELRDESERTRVWYGNIGSGSSMMRNARRRDELRDTYDLIGLEMEAAGIMNTLPTGVIRGVCDYGDGQKNKDWQPYAAAVAAVYAKGILYTIKPKRARVPKDVLWTVPFPRNERFVGRTLELDQLSTRLSSIESCQRVAMVGLGGVGKTQIVLEFAYRKRSTTPDCSIVWIPATQPSAFEQAYRRVGTDLKIPGIAADGADVKYMVKENLSKHTAGPWLLIVDNADDSEMLFERKYGENAKYALIDYLPFSPNGSIIFTTRNRKAAIKQAANNIIHVGMMENDVAREVLSKSLVQPEILDDTAATDQLLDLLDRLPLAIIQAAAYMNENDVTVAQYIELYNESEKEKIEMLSEHFEDEGRYREGQNSIATTWFISFNQIRQRSLVAIESLSFMACLLHQNIPQSVLPPATSKREFIEAIGILTAYSFVVKQDNGQIFGMHRLVHLATRNWLRTEGNLSSWTNKAFERLTEIIPAGGHKNRKVWTAYLPHAKHILTSLDMAEGHDKVIILSDHLGKCLYSNGQYIEAEQAHRNTLDLRMRSLGLDHPDTLDSSAFLAEALSHQGKFTEAEMLHEQTLRRRKNVLGAEHPDVMVSMQYLGQVFAGQGNYIQAEKMHREARDLRVKILGAENRNTLTSRSYLGEALNQQGRHKEAEQMHQQTLEIRLRVLGLEYPATLASMSCLGVAQRNLGKYSDAEKTQRQVLEHRTRVLGTRHPHTLITKRWLADALHHQRKYSESVEINQEVFDLQVQLLGPKNPDTLFTLSSLADTLHCLGKTDQAERTHEEVLHLRVQSLGAEHPDTLKSKSSLAQILYEQGKEQEATDMQQQVLDLRVKSLGIEHPHTQLSKLMLENMQQSLTEPPAQEV